jgi:hypothetical protein
MSRNTLVLAACCVLLASGCEKKEPEFEPTVVHVGPSIDAPPGMQVLQDNPPLFITSRPVTAGQYIDYLKVTGQPLPTRLQAVTLGPDVANQPISGLTRNEADRYAVWAVKRLPTREEWRLAADMVGDTPYPWGAGFEDLPVAAPLFLAQDWLPGSEIEQEAKRKKNELGAAVLADNQAMTQELREELTDLLTDREVVAAERWQDFKPAFFALIEKTKKLAELRETQKRRADQLGVLQQVARAKGDLAIAITTAEEGAETPEAAIEQYKTDLANWRAEIQKTKQNLEELIKSRQEQVIQMTKQFDEEGSAAAAVSDPEAKALLAETESEAGDPQAALAVIKKLEDKIAALQAKPSPLENLPPVEGLQGQAAQMDSAIEQVPEDKETADKIAESLALLERLGTTVKQDFLDEKLLVNEIAELVVLRAQREAVDANLAALKGVMDQLGGPGTRADQ